MFDSEVLVSETTEAPSVSQTSSNNEDELIMAEGLVVGLFFVPLIESRLEGGLLYIDSIVFCNRRISENEDSDVFLGRFWCGN